MNKTKRILMAERIERAITTNNKQEKLWNELSVGYRAQNGYIFTEYDCKEYNQEVREINRWIKSSLPMRDGLIDHGHVIFKMITGMK